MQSNEVIADSQVHHANMASASDTQITIINDNNNSFTNTPFIAPAFETRILPDAPGLGFDYAHLAAIGRGRVASVPTGFISGGFFLPSYSQPAPVVVVQPAPVVVVQQPAVAPPDDPADHPRSLRDEKSVPPPDPAPVRDIGQFVLVRRDGRQLFAVAFTVQDGKISYVTREGVRRSVDLSDLDLDVTRQENEERGTTLRLPVR
jgi:hypothetical protein